MTEFYTYFHTRNDTGAVFYVGKGKGTRAHERGRNQYRHRIVVKCGHKVHMARTNLTEAEAFEHERFLISCFKDMGVPLCNLTDGGEGSSGWVMPEEVKVKIGITNAQRVWTEEQKVKLRQAAVGKFYPPKSAEHKAKLSAALKGRPVPKERCLKIAIANTGKVPSQATRDKLSLANTGRVHSDAERLKMSDAAKARSASPEARLYLSEIATAAAARRREKANAN